MRSLVEDAYLLTRSMSASIFLEENFYTATLLRNEFTWIYYLSTALSRFGGLDLYLVYLALTL